eukprot:EG_transcript_1070
MTDGVTAPALAARLAEYAAFDEEEAVLLAGVDELLSGPVKQLDRDTGEWAERFLRLQGPYLMLFRDDCCKDYLTFLCLTGGEVEEAKGEEQFVVSTLHRVQELRLRRSDAPGAADWVPRLSLACKQVEALKRMLLVRREQRQLWLELQRATDKRIEDLEVRGKELSEEEFQDPLESPSSDAQAAAMATEIRALKQKLRTRDAELLSLRAWKAQVTERERQRRERLEERHGLQMTQLQQEKDLYRTKVEEIQLVLQEYLTSISLNATHRQTENDVQAIDNCHRCAETTADLRRLLQDLKRNEHRLQAMLRTFPTQAQEEGRCAETRSAGTSPVAETCGQISPLTDSISDDASLPLGQASPLCATPLEGLSPDLSVESVLSDDGPFPLRGRVRFSEEIKRYEYDLVDGLEEEGTAFERPPSDGGGGAEDISPPWDDVLRAEFDLLDAEGDGLSVYQCAQLLVQAGCSLAEGAQLLRETQCLALKELDFGDCGQFCASLDARYPNWTPTTPPRDDIFRDGRPSVMNYLTWLEMARHPIDLPGCVSLLLDTALATATRVDFPAFQRLRLSMDRCLSPVTLAVGVVAPPTPLADPDEGMVSRNVSGDHDLGSPVEDWETLAATLADTQRSLQAEKEASALQQQLHAGQLAQVEERLQRAQEARSQLLTTMQGLKSQVSDKEVLIQRLQESEKQAVVTILELMQAGMPMADVAGVSLADALQQASTAVEAIRRELQELQDQVWVLDAENAALLQGCQHLEQQQAAAGNELRAVQAELQAAKAELQAGQAGQGAMPLKGGACVAEGKPVCDCAQQLLLLTDEKRLLSAELQASREALAALRTTYEELEAQCVRLSEEGGKLRADRENLLRRIPQMLAGNAVAPDVAALLSSSGPLDTDRRHLRLLEHSLNQQRKTMQEEYTSLEQHNRAWEQEVADARQEASAVAQEMILQVQRLQKKLLAKQREVEQLKLEKAKGPAKAELAAIEHYEVLLKDMHRKLAESGQRLAEERRRARQQQPAPKDPPAPSPARRPCAGEPLPLATLPIDTHPCATYPQPLRRAHYPHAPGYPMANYPTATYPMVPNSRTESMPLPPGALARAFTYEPRLETI